MAGRHYRTVVSRSCSCNACGRSLRGGGECVYRYAPREILCVTCAEDRGVKARPSLRWEKSRKRKGQLTE
jgi:hypothetical protein